jgi:serine/threonine-protein kinase
MATMFGRFEIQSELSQSETASIYKALDTTTNQTVALKTQSLKALGEGEKAFVNALLAEGESTRDLVAQNVVVLYGAGEIEGQFCAAMEYIQGNSVATMLARKEGFSIWDLLDITRQVCTGLEQAAAKGVVHHSLEPAKIMVQWDGMVKILGYGISTMSLIQAEQGNGLGRLMPYCSPEQIRGEEIDLRSNVFTLGTILYEMVVGRKAFDAEDPVALVSQIQNDVPANPSSVNPKIQPAVSALIMKAMAKEPGERYQTARALVADLEECKESGKKSAPEAKKAVAAPAVPVDPAARAAAASKFVSAGTAVKPKPAQPPTSGQAPARLPAVPPAVRLTGGAGQASPPVHSAATGMKAAAAAATAGGLMPGNARYSTGTGTTSEFDVQAPEPHAAPAGFMAAAAVEPEVQPSPARVSFDPMMAAPAAGSTGTSFSDLAEMPPLKEPIFAPTIPEPEEFPELMSPVEQILARKKEEKPKIQPREVAEKAMQQIATVPPRLMLFSILGAVALILFVSLWLFFHVRSEDDGSTAAPRPAKPAASQDAAVVESPAPTVAPINEARPNLKVRQLEKRANGSRKVAVAAPAPEVIPGQALIDSSPQGAVIQVDGKTDAAWVTPFTVSGLAPGKHVIAVNKSGYSPEVRSVDVASGGKLSLNLHLTAMNALVVLGSTPPGAEVVLDGKPTGRLTPAQFAVEKGTHTVLLRKQGYLDETVSADLGPAQNFQYAPALRALGNVQDIKTVGKLNKLFGRGSESAAGMGSISIHTQPKGAQVAINQRVLDKLAPLDVMLGPGNYIVDVTLTGFKPVHKVVSVEKGGKVAIDDILERQ